MLLLVGLVAAKTKMPEGAVPVTFHNLLNNQVELSWVNPGNGKEETITTVASHADNDQITYPGHTFIAREVGKAHVLLGHYHITVPEHFNIPAVFAGDVDAHQVCSEDRKEFDSVITADEGCVPFFVQDIC